MDSVHRNTPPKIHKLKILKKMKTLFFLNNFFSFIATNLDFNSKYAHTKELSIHGQKHLIIHLSVVATENSVP
jgi:hypothetical protein